MDCENIVNSVAEAEAMEEMIVKAPSKGLKFLGLATAVGLASAAFAKFVVVPVYKKVKTKVKEKKDGNTTKA